MNKIIRNSVSIALALAVLTPALTLAKEDGQAKAELHMGTHGDVRASISSKLNSFLHMPNFVNFGDKASESDRDASASAKAHAHADLKANLPGSVTTINGDGSFTVTGDNGKVIKVTTSSATTVKVRNDKKGSLADVVVGSKVIVRGAWNSSKDQIAATQVQIVDATKNPISQWFKSLLSLHIVTGTVSALNGNTLSVKGQNDVTYSVDISSAKLLGKNPFVVESSADLKVGDRVQVLGNVASASVTAEIVHDLTASK